MRDFAFGAKWGVRAPPNPADGTGVEKKEKLTIVTEYASANLLGGFSARMFTRTRKYGRTYRSAPPNPVVGIHIFFEM